VKRLKAWLARAVLGLFLLVLGGLYAGCCAYSVRGYQGPVSDHFDGKRFHTQQEHQEVTLGRLLRWMASRDQGPWSQHPDAIPGPPPPWRVPDGQLRVTFIGHATMLVQLDGVNVLTDPIYSLRASPFSIVGPKRVRPPGIAFDDLPPIHAVVISHNHYDHMDLPTLKRLQAQFPPMKIFAGLGNRDFLESKGLQHVTDMDWWQSARVGSVEIVAVPTRHGSNRGMCDRNNTLWAGYVFKGQGGSAYFGGDTGYGPHFAQTQERLGPMRLAMLPIGAFRPEWFMEPVHMSPDQAVRAQKDLGAKTAVAMHFGTFPLADDGETESVEKLGVRSDFWVLGFGEGRDVPVRSD
jgi:L-ascorbate metabolism protein UlaG (beta-lactamase superfamily)